MVDRKYEESVRAKGDKENSWADKYEEDFKSMNREFTQKDGEKGEGRRRRRRDNNGETRG